MHGKIPIWTSDWVHTNSTLSYQQSRILIVSYRTIHVPCGHYLVNLKPASPSPLPWKCSRGLRMAPTKCTTAGGINYLEVFFPTLVGLSNIFFLFFWSNCLFRITICYFRVIVNAKIYWHIKKYTIIICRTYFIKKFRNLIWRNISVILHILNNRFKKSTIN